jgi:hypothetical protein
MFHKLLFFFEFSTIFLFLFVRGILFKKKKNQWKSIGNQMKIKKIIIQN